LPGKAIARLDGDTDALDLPSLDYLHTGNFGDDAIRLVAGVNQRLPSWARSWLLQMARPPQWTIQLATFAAERDSTSTSFVRP